MKKGRWWKEEDDSKSGKGKKKKSEGVNALEESGDARQVRQLTELLAQMQVAQQQQNEKICALTGQQEAEKKEKEELSWEAKAKAQADEIAQLRAQAAGSAASRWCRRHQDGRRAWWRLRAGWRWLRARR